MHYFNLMVKIIVINIEKLTSIIEVSYKDANSLFSSSVNWRVDWNDNFPFM